jgi:type I restriction enzyme M protein
MIPLVVLRRLDSVLEIQKKEVLAEYNKLKAAGKYEDEAIEKIIFRKFGLSYFNTSGFTFAIKEPGLFARLKDDPDGLASNLKNFIAGFSGNARSILEKFKFEEEIDKLDDSNRLFKIVQEITKPEINLHPDSVPNVVMGYIFEDLVRRFNEQANEEAGDHFTPREVISLMVNLLFTNEDQVYKSDQVIKIYDPTCGTGGMLSVSEKYISDQNENAHIELFGQEYNPESYAICGSDMLIKGEDVKNIAFGDTLGTGRQKEDQVDGDGHADKQFNYMLANPPFGVEWKPEKDYVTAEFENLGFSGRFGAGLPRINDGALLFLQHMISKMHSAPDCGGLGSRIGVVFNGSPLFTGDAGSGESNIRRWILENDLLEAVIGLPDQLFYNTGINTYIWMVTNRKSDERKGKVQLIDGTQFIHKMKKSMGNKRNKIGGTEKGEPDHISELTQLYGRFKDDDSVELTLAHATQKATSKIFENREFGYLKITVERPLRLNFLVDEKRIERFQQTTYFKNLTISKKRKSSAAKDKDIAVGKKQQEQILAILTRMLTTEHTKDTEGKIKDRAVFEEVLEKAFSGSEVKLDTALKKALLAPDSLGERDPTAEICRKKNGDPEPDAELRDTENVPLPEGITLPLPLEYASKENKGKVDVKPLLKLVQPHCEDYLAAEVLPYRPDAWIDHSKIKVGYEIPFTRHFYTYTPPRPLDEIAADLKALEKSIGGMLAEVTR